MTKLGRPPACCQSTSLKIWSATPRLKMGISTISGLLTQRLGGFPKEGDKLEVGKFEIEVTETAGPKVEKVKFSRKL